MKRLQLTSNDFEAFIEVLHKVGNNRMPYVIFVNTDEWMSDAENKAAFLDNHARPLLMHLETSNYITHADPEYHMPTAYTVQDVLDSTIGSDELVVVVVGEIKDILLQPVSLLINELHSRTEIDNAAFKQVKKLDNMFIYVRRIIDDPNIIALQSKDFAKTLQLQGFVQWQPWHTLLLHKPTGNAVQIFWDTREIVGFAKLTEQQIAYALQQGNANDNCNVLWQRCDMPSDTAFEQFITGTIQ